MTKEICDESNDEAQEPAEEGTRVGAPLGECGEQPSDKEGEAPNPLALSHDDSPIPSGEAATRVDPNEDAVLESAEAGSIRAGLGQDASQELQAERGGLTYAEALRLAAKSSELSGT